MAAQYANGFSFSIKDDFTEIIIEFNQTLPTVDPEGGVSGIKTESISTIILNQDTATALLSKLRIALPDPEISK